MSDREFWQLYAWLMTAVLWLLIFLSTAVLPWLRARRAPRRLRAPHHSARRNGTEAVTR